MGSGADRVAPIADDALPQLERFDYLKPLGPPALFRPDCRPGEKCCAITDHVEGVPVQDQTPSDEVQLHEHDGQAIFGRRPCVAAREGLRVKCGYGEMPLFQLGERQRICSRKPEVIDRNRLDPLKPFLVVE